MASYTEQEEIETLKSWWKNYGNSLVAGVAVGVLLLIGQKYWNSYHEQQLAKAAQTYQELVQLVQQKNVGDAHKRASVLFEQYSGTPYAALGGLVIGRYEMDAGNVIGAREALEKALKYADDDATAHAARLNLARALTAEGKTEQALNLLPAQDVAGFESQYAETRGDILRQLGKNAEALDAYESALKALPPGSPYQNVLTMKRDSVNTVVKQ